MVELNMIVYFFQWKTNFTMPSNFLKTQAVINCTCKPYRTVRLHSQAGCSMAKEYVAYTA